MPHRRTVRHLGLKAFHLRLQRAHVGSGEGRVEACQHLAGAHGLALAHVDKRLAIVSRLLPQSAKIGDHVLFVVCLAFSRSLRSTASASRQVVHFVEL
jgi:hypothetical protein